MLELHFDKNTVYPLTAFESWAYNVNTETTTFVLKRKSADTLIVKGNWCKVITLARAKGAIATDGSTLTFRQ